MAPALARMSTTTISLPRPFILMKAWLASALMGFRRFIWATLRLWPASKTYGNHSPTATRRRRPVPLLCPAHDLGFDEALQLVGQRAHHRENAAVGKILLEFGLGQNGTQLSIWLVECAMSGYLARFQTTLATPAPDDTV